MTISWIQAILLGIFSTCLQCLVWGFSIGNYTLGRPFDRWVDFRFNSWRCDNQYYGRGCPSSRLYRLVTPGGTVSADIACHLLHRCSSCYLVCACNNITDEAGIASCSSNRCSRWDNRYSSFSTVPLLWTWYGNTLVGKPLKKETSKKLYAVDWVYPGSLISSSLPSNNDYHQIRWKHGWFDETIPSMDGYWMKALLQSVLFSHVSYCHLVEKQIVTEATDFIPFFVGFTLAKSRLNLVSSAVVSLIFAVIYYELEDQIDESCSSRSGGPRRWWGGYLKWLIERKFQRKH